MAVTNLAYPGVQQPAPVVLADALGNVTGNVEAVVFPSAARTTTTTSADTINANSTALHAILVVTSIGTGSVTLTINAKDPASGNYYPLLTGAAVVANGTTVYRIGRGLAAVANLTANDSVARTLQFVLTSNNANSVTASLGIILGE